MLRSQLFRKIAPIILAALGAGLFLLALVLWARMALTASLADQQQALYLAYEWLPEPTIVPPTPTTAPTPLPTPTPTSTPRPQPPTRVVIAKIDVNSAIRQVGVNIEGDPYNPRVTWEELTSGVGHYENSMNPGESGNIILLGHNNIHGAIFRRLSDLAAGDEIDLFTLDQRFSYVVQETGIVRAVGATEQDKRMHDHYLGPKSEQVLTLVSCWPYTTYTHRIYVVAEWAGVTNQ